VRNQPYGGAGYFDLDVRSLPTVSLSLPPSFRIPFVSVVLAHNRWQLADQVLSLPVRLLVFPPCLARFSLSLCCSFPLVLAQVQGAVKLELWDRK